MKRVLLDTNVYGELILDKETSGLLLNLVPVELIVYGSEVNRKELRGVPEEERTEDWSGKDRSKRLLLLNLYDLLTQNDERTYRTTPFVEILSLQYFDEYTRLGGKRGYEELRRDFVIVAASSIHNLDLIVSKDTKTMLSKEARKSYENVNSRNQLRTPQLFDYQEFKSLVRKMQ